jgi:AraC family transcriptional regulator of adaptative response/methylated-DNA-[protein]-cysteine methyltransferase
MIDPASIQPAGIEPAGIEQDPRWSALLARDPGADGAFFYSVRTTGVYCRPSCAARRPRPENVRFHTTQAEAERAGFRACRRCRPDGVPPATEQAALVARACRAMEAAETPPGLAELAAEAGLSPWHFHRVFKLATGLTPRAYAAARRAERLRSGLTAGASVTQAIYEAGFNASSRFYEQADALLGMTASAWRAGAPDTGISYAVGACSLGAILVAASARGICAILLGDDADTLARSLRARFPRATLVGDDPAFARLVADAVALVEAPDRGLDLPLDVRGTAFQHRVWQALRAIPAGQTASYGEIAARIGQPGAARAVGAACAANMLAVAIPCHRVVRRDAPAEDGAPAAGSYRWGAERKRALLARERRP